MIAYLKIKFPKKFNQNFIKSKIKTLKVKDLANKALFQMKLEQKHQLYQKLKVQENLSILFN